MNALIDLPTRRVEAWKYSDLRAAMDESVQVTPKRDASAPEVEAARAASGIIGALAAQAGSVEVLAVAAGEARVRVDRPYYANFEPRLLDVRLAPGAEFTRVVIQAESEFGVVLDAARVSVGAGAVFRQIVLAEGARLARVETHVSVEGAGAKVALHGCYMTRARRHADLTSTIEHKVEAGETHQLIKGVARRGGRGVFQGKIVVGPGAQKTDARQHHNGMLLEEGAEIFAKPELMIYADDVACAHGNTAGGIDEQALFYLRARGVPETEARALLTEAFLLEAIPEWTPEESRLEIEARVAAWLRSAP